MFDSNEMVRILKELGLKPFSYSGRSMYGARCVAIRIDRTKTVPAVIAEAMYDCMTDENDMTELLRFFTKSRTDSLGLDEVLYTPSCPWPDGVIEQTEDDDAE